MGRTGGFSVRQPRSLSANASRQLRFDPDEHDQQLFFTSTHRSPIEAGPRGGDHMAGFCARPFCAALFIAIPLAGSAQEAAPSRDQNDSQDIDEIESLVITARRRPEFLQETPVATTVLGGELLEQRNVNSLEDI